MWRPRHPNPDPNPNPNPNPYQEGIRKAQSTEATAPRAEAGTTLDRRLQPYAVAASTYPYRSMAKHDLATYYHHLTTLSPYPLSTLPALPSYHLTSSYHLTTLAIVSSYPLPAPPGAWPSTCAATSRSARVRQMRSPRDLHAISTALLTHLLTCLRTFAYLLSPRSQARQMRSRPSSPARACRPPSPRWCPPTHSNPNPNRNPDLTPSPAPNPNPM